MASAVAKSPVLIVGHPGHELRVYGWLVNVRPRVHVITDGSGSDGASRIDSTTAVLDGAAASHGPVYGRLTDREIYDAILTNDHARFIALAEELAADLDRAGADLVAGDAVEGFNPSHDVCRYVINAAVRLAARRRGAPIPCFAFPLDGAPSQRTAGLNGDEIRVHLDDALLERKLGAAHGYTELRDEIQRMLERYGVEPFRTEYLWSVDLSDPYALDPGRVPLYESHGAQRVASGVYRHVLTFREHVKPLADALFAHSAEPA